MEKGGRETGNRIKLASIVGEDEGHHWAENLRGIKLKDVISRERKKKKEKGRLDFQGTQTNTFKRRALN